MLASQSDIPAERQRLIFSGRILKDPDTLESCKITKSGQTIHLVRGAVPANSTTSSVASSTNSAPAANTSASSASQVPTNISTGTGSGNILADLTGARYAGFANLPSASMFGPDGGMGPAPNSDDIIRMMETPGFSESMQEALQNPQIVDMMINSNPQLRGMAPQFRQMMQNPEFREMFTNPQMLRQAMQFERMFGQFRGGEGAGGQSAGSFPAPGSATSDSATSTNNTTSNTTGASGDSNTNAANPFAALLQRGAPAGNNGFDLQLLSQMFGAGAGAGGAGAGMGLGAAAAEPQDNRPPEERYESQLRQLNELGFVDFDRNVRALRRAGGNVQGAVEALLDGQV